MLTEIPAVFFGLLSFYLYINKEYFFSGLIVGISFLTKFPMVSLFLVLLIATVEKYKNFLKIVLGFYLPVIIFLLLNFYWYNMLSTIHRRS